MASPDNEVVAGREIDGRQSDRAVDSGAVAVDELQGDAAEIDGVGADVGDLDELGHIRAGLVVVDLVDDEVGQLGRHGVRLVDQLRRVEGFADGWTADESGQAFAVEVVAHPVRDAVGVGAVGDREAPPTVNEMPSKPAAENDRAVGEVTGVAVE